MTPCLAAFRSSPASFARARLPQEAAVLLLSARPTASLARRAALSSQALAVRQPFRAMSSQPQDAGSAQQLAGKKRPREDGSASAGAAPRRGFDWSKYRFRHVALHVIYLGHDYHGLAAQDTPAGLADGLVRRGGEKAASAGADGAAAGPSTPATPAHQVPTVEAALFAALTRTCLLESRASAGYTRCGRTDRGVSAGGQILALRLRSKAKRGDVPPAPSSSSDDGSESTDAAGVEFQRPWLSSPLPPEHAYWLADTPPADPGLEVTGGDDSAFFHRWSRPDGLPNTGEPFPPPPQEMDYAAILNGVLPPDIRVLGWADVPDDFSARFSAAIRTYRYYFPARGLDLDAMNAAGAKLVGVHDFRNFCKVDVTATQNFVREVLSVRVVAAGSEYAVGSAYTPGGKVGAAAGMGFTSPEAASRAVSDRVCYLEVRGRAFLWHQVRCLAGVLFHVGRGYEPPAIVDALLDVHGACPRRPQYALAPEAPLILHHCSFGEEEEEGREGGTGSEADAAHDPNGPAEEEDGEDGSSGAAAGDRPFRFRLRDPGLYSRMHHSPAGLRRATVELERQWSELALKAAMLRGLLDRVYALPVAVEGGGVAPWGALVAAGMGGSGASASSGGAEAAAGTSGAGAAPAPPLGSAAGLRLSDVDYSIQGVPPPLEEIAALGAAITAGRLPSASAASAAAAAAVRPRGAYIPLLARHTGLSVEEKWSSLSEAKKAAVAAAHPQNTKKLVAALAAGSSSSGGGGSGEQK